MPNPFPAASKPEESNPVKSVAVSEGNKESGVMGRSMAAVSNKMDKL